MSGVLIALGLLILFISLIPNHALAFVGFAMLGAPLLLAGIVWYLISLLRESTSEHGGNAALEMEAAAEKVTRMLPSE